MLSAIQIRWFYIISFAFAILNIVAIAFDFYWIGAIPLTLVFVYLLVYKLDSLLLLLALMIPLSIHFDDIGMGLGISLPDEPVIILISGLFVLKFLIEGKYDLRILKHPISVAIIVNLIWILITACTSKFPIISLKFFASRFWYTIVFYFLGVLLFKRFKNIISYLWMYLIPLFLIVLFTLYKHSKFDFSILKSYSVIEPFFNDHGIYAATLSFFIPLTFCCLIFYRRFKLNTGGAVLSFIILITLLFGVYYSYTRAAWIGIAVATSFLIPVLLRIKFNTLLIIVFSGLIIGFVFQDDIIFMLSKNNDKHANDITSRLKSISNIKTDPSNTERINRWMSAISMFEEKPVVGFGPGTYSFCYAPFQEFKYKTIISTNFGDRGNAHSEYLNPLAEMGLLGLLTFLAIIYFVLNTAMRLYFSARKFKVRIISLALVLGLMTYFIHGFMNNYSDSDKIGAILWSSFGMITALDLYHNKEKDQV